MHTTIKYTKFNAGDLSFSTPEENKVIPNLVKYRQISLVSHSKYLINGLEIVPRIQGPWMNLDTYGFPGEIDKYRNPLSELELRKLKVPLSLNNPEIKKFHELLSAIDKKCEDDKEKIWGDKAYLYRYEPMICKYDKEKIWGDKAYFYRYEPMICKSPEELEDEEQKPDYITLKFKPFYYPSSINFIKTKVYLNIDGVVLK
jgi:hypothetical protein